MKLNNSGTAYTEIADTTDYDFTYLNISGYSLDNNSYIGYYTFATIEGINVRKKIIFYLKS